MTLRNVLPLCLFVFMWQCAFCQKDSSNMFTGGHIIFSGGLSYQKQPTGEIGIMYGTIWGESPCSPGIYHGPKLSTEFNFNSSQFFMGPKISYEFDLLFIGGRINFIDYTNFKQQDLRFTPEVGLTVLGFINLFYGYNIPLSTQRINNVGFHRLTLTVNLDKNFKGN